MKIPEYATFSAAHIFENSIYFSGSEFNGLFKYDMETQDSELLGRFSSESNAQELHRKIVQYCNKLFFLPYRNNRCVIDVYDMETQKIYEIRFWSEDVSQGARTFEYIVDNCKIWIFCREYTFPLVIFDMDSESQEKIIYWNEEIAYEHHAQIGGPLLRSCVKVRDEIWMPITATAVFAVVNINTGKTIYYKITDKQYEFDLAEFDGEKFWITLKGKKEIITLNITSGIIEEYCLDVDFEFNPKMTYSNIICVNNKVFLMETYGKYLMFVDKEKHKIDIIGEPREISEVSSGIPKEIYIFDVIKGIGTKVYCLLTTNATILFIDTDTLEISQIEIPYPKEIDADWYMENVIAPNIFDAEYIFEGKKDDVGLDDFVKAVVMDKITNLNYQKKVSEYSEKNVKTILQYMKELFE